MSNINIELELESNRNQDIETVELADAVYASINRETPYQVEFYRSGGVIEFIANMAQNAMDNKELLIILFTGAKSAVEHLVKQHKPEQVEVTVEVDGAKYSFKGNDSKTVSQMIEEFQAANRVQALPSAKPKIKAKIRK